MHNLKNCPFCGGEAYINAYTYDGHINYDHETVYTVKCTNRKCRLQSIEAVTKDGEVSHEDAISRVTSLWNARYYDADTDNKSSEKNINEIHIVHALKVKAKKIRKV